MAIYLFLSLVILVAITSLFKWPYLMHIMVGGIDILLSGLRLVNETPRIWTLIKVLLFDHSRLGMAQGTSRTLVYKSVTPSRILSSVVGVTNYPRY